MNYYTLEETRKIIANWDAWGFWVSKELEEFRASMSEDDFIAFCQSQFNGTGADSMSDSQRKILSFMLKLRETVGMHDLDYYLSDGTLRGWKWADTRFYENGRIEIRARWKVYNPYRYLMFVKLRIAKYLLDKAGATAYKSAYERFASVDSGQWTVDNEE
ncbi:MAG: hypothetical protein R3Y46_02050 [Opitutales bacterium]